MSLWLRSSTVRLEELDVRIEDAKPAQDMAVSPHQLSLKQKGDKHSGSGSTHRNQTIWELIELSYNPSDISKNMASKKMCFRTAFFQYKQSKSHLNQNPKTIILCEKNR